MMQSVFASSASPWKRRASRRGGRRARAVRVTLVILFGLLVATYGFSVYTIRDTFYRRTERLEATPESYGLASESVSFHSADGVPLAAWWIPGDSACGSVILLHGMDGADASTMLGHAAWLNRAGYGVLVLDMRAHGRSGGNRICLAFEEPMDVSAAVDWLLAQPNLADRPIALVGLSMGAATAIRSAAMREEVDAVVSMSSFSSVDHMLLGAMRLMGCPANLASALAPFMRLALATVYRVRPAIASPIHDISRVSPRPILLIHGTMDDQVALDNAELLKEAAGDGTELWIVDGAGHLLFRSEDFTGPEDEQLRAGILEFLDRSLGY